MFFINFVLFSLFKAEAKIVPCADKKSKWQMKINQLLQGQTISEHNYGAQSRESSICSLEFVSLWDISTIDKK